QHRRDLENAEAAIRNLGVEGIVSAESLAANFADRGDTLTTAERAAMDRTWTYGHIVVDEAQELTPMQWRLLRRRGPLRSFTIVGDLAQASVAEAPASWADAIAALGDEFRLEHLTVNYRTPRQITELAERRAIADGLPVTPTRAVRDGLWPVARFGGPRERIAHGTVKAVQRDRDTDAAGTLAVIAPEPLVALLHDRLAAELPEPVGFGAEGLGARVSVLGPRTAKGLEFDAVVVVDQEGIAATEGPGALYVALTRPTQRLSLVEPTAVD
ncbi:MAG: AAA family ATPase, partial [Amnibacterium sp.]